MPNEAETDIFLERISRCTKGPCIMAILESYFDESGTHAGSSYTVVGGCLMEREKAQAFPVTWEATLADYGLDHFHSSDFESRLHPFDKLDNAQRVELQAKLSAIMCDHVSTVIAAGFKTSDYDTALQECGVSEFDGPYALCGLMVVSLIRRWCDKNSYIGEIPHIFDTAQGHAKEFVAAYEIAKKLPGGVSKYRLGGLNFRDKKRVIPLQAADKLAYEAYKYQDALINATSRRPRLSFLALAGKLGNGAQEFFAADKEPLVAIIKDMGISQN